MSNREILPGECAADTENLTHVRSLDGHCAEFTANPSKLITRRHDLLSRRRMIAKAAGLVAEEESGASTAPADSGASSHCASGGCAAVDDAMRAAEEALDEREHKIVLIEQQNEALKLLREIEENTRLFVDESERAAASVAAKARLASIAQELSRLGGCKVQYFRPMDLIKGAAEVVQRHHREHASDDRYLPACVERIEEMLNRLPNSRAGAELTVISGKVIKTNSGFVLLSTDGKEQPVPEGELIEKRDGYAVMRPKLPLAPRDGSIEELAEHIAKAISHLAERLAMMNRDHDQKVQLTLELAIVKEAIACAMSGTLPKDSTIIFFEKGKFVQNKGSDGSGLHTQFFDVERIRTGGLSQGGGRFDRLQGHHPDGYIIVAPKLGRDGNPLVITDKRNGKKIVAKEIIEVSGCVPLLKLKDGKEVSLKGQQFGAVYKTFQGPFDDRSMAAAMQAERGVGSQEALPCPAGLEKESALKASAQDGTAFGVPESINTPLV